jgi:hypothetical protein
MKDMATQAGRSTVVSILPYQLKALRRRQQAARAVFGIAPPAPAPKAQASFPEATTMRAGIRHMASGRMTVLDEGLSTVSAMLTERAARGRGLLEHSGLEAIVVDGRKQVFAGFWS